MRSNGVRDAAFAVERVIEDIRARGARVAILVLDACRDNPFAPAGARAAARAGRPRPRRRARRRVRADVGGRQAGGAGSSLPRRRREEFGLHKGVPAASSPSPAGRWCRSPRRLRSGSGTSPPRSATSRRPPITTKWSATSCCRTPKSGAPLAGAVPSEGAKSALAPTRQQLAALAPDPQLSGALKVGVGAPIANFMRSNAGWTVTISLPEPAIAISYRIGEAGAFKLTGPVGRLGSTHRPAHAQPVASRWRAGRGGDHRGPL